MTDLDLDKELEIGVGEVKRLGDCTGPEIEAALRLIARKRIDLAWAREQAAGGSPDGRMAARRFFAQATEAERDLFAYWQVVRIVEDERLNDDVEGPEGSGASWRAALSLGTAIVRTEDPGGIEPPVPVLDLNDR